MQPIVKKCPIININISSASIDDTIRCSTLIIPCIGYNKRIKIPDSKLDLTYNLLKDNKNFFVRIIQDGTVDVNFVSHDKPGTVLYDSNDKLLYRVEDDLHNYGGKCTWPTCYVCNPTEQISTRDVLRYGIISYTT